MLHELYETAKARVFEFYRWDGYSELHLNVLAVLWTIYAIPNMIVGFVSGLWYVISARRKGNDKVSGNVADFHDSNEDDE